MKNLLEKIKRGMQWVFNDQARFAVALILLMFLVVGAFMFISPTSAETEFVFEACNGDVQCELDAAIAEGLFKAN